ncbi:hypothetical protein J4447_04635 [Candidatus Pacearchaeota archaeon]|nr:hypothetical protein [Candidatus Pacearchaeota archaeon]
MQDYSEELRGLIERYKVNGFEYGKPVDYLEFRNGCPILRSWKETC